MVSQLRSEAADLERRGRAALDAGDGPLAQELLDRSILRTEIADALEAGEGAPGLLAREQSRNVNKDMLAVHKVAISEGRSKDPLAVAARKAGMSVTALAKRVGVSKALLSMARTGERTIKRSVCERIEKLTGYAASKANWPGITG